ncbi:MAG: lasso peptide biosynthesis B2 protein [Nitrospiraceae bacterium]
MVRKLRKLCNLGAAEHVLLVQLFVCALAAHVSLRVFDLPRITRFVARFADRQSLHLFPLGLHRCREDRLAILVHAAARLVNPRGSCLIRSLLLFWLFRCKHEPVALLVGVSKESGIFFSHAWVEHIGKVCDDPDNVARRFVPLLRLEAR